MTYPITPNPAIHNEPPSVAVQQNTTTVTQMQAMGQQMIQGITNAVLYFMTGGIVGAQAGSNSDTATDNLQAWFTQLYGQLQTSLTNFSALVTSVGGTTFNDLTTFFQNLQTDTQDIIGSFAPGGTAAEFVTGVQNLLTLFGLSSSSIGTTTDLTTFWTNIVTDIINPLNALEVQAANIIGDIEISAINGLAAALSDLLGTTAFQALLDGIANAFGHSGTGHTLSDIETYFGIIPPANVTNVLGGANLGADVSSVHSTATDASAWSTRLTNDLLVTSDVFHLTYAAGTPTDPPGTLSGGKPTWYSAWNDLLALAGVVNSVTPPTDAAPAVGTAITTAQSAASTAVTNAQNLADAAHQAVYGGTATGTATDISTLKSAQTAIPSENLVPIQNPNSSGMVAHGATGTSWTTATTAGNLLTITGSHTIATGDNYCVVPILYDTSTTVISSVNRAVTYGTAPMSSLGLVSLLGGVWIEFFGLFGVPSGAKTITATVASINNIEGLVGSSSSFSGVGSVGAVATITGAGTSLSQTVASATGDMVVQAFAVFATSAITLGSYNKTQRSNSGTVADSVGDRLVLALGDTAGASSLTFTATTSVAAIDYAGMALNLIPAAAVIGSGIRQHRAGTGSVSASSGGPNLFPSAFFDTTDRITPDMSVSNNAVTVTQAGWYHVQIRALIASASASTGMITFSAALYVNGSVNQILSGNSVVFNIVGAQDYISNVAGTGLVYCNAGDVLNPGYYQDGIGTFSSLSFTGEPTGWSTHWSVTLANRSLL